LEKSARLRTHRRQRSTRDAFLKTNHTTPTPNTRPTKTANAANAKHDMRANGTAPNASRHRRSTQ
jgi:hypothetical protein